MSSMKPARPHGRIGIDRAIGSEAAESKRQGAESVREADESTSTDIDANT
jgi:hypothetical protein